MTDFWPLINLFHMAIYVVLVIMVASQEGIGCLGGGSVLTHEVFIDQEGPPYLV